MCSRHIPGHAAEGHHDGMVCLSEWKTFFAWCTEHGEGEKYLAKAEEAATKRRDQRKFTEDDRLLKELEALHHADDAAEAGDHAEAKHHRTIAQLIALQTKELEAYHDADEATSAGRDEDVQRHRQEAKAARQQVLALVEKTGIQEPGKLLSS